MKHQMDLINAAREVMGMAPVATEVGSQPDFPKCNIYRMLDGSPYTCFMEFALSGYEKGSLEINMQGDYLVVSSKTDSDKEKGREYTHRGIARRDFVAKYHVGKDIEVRNAKFADGLLTVELEKLQPQKSESSIKIE